MEPLVTTNGLIPENSGTFKIRRLIYAKGKINTPTAT
jgi:hypothetical protein